MPEPGYKDVLRNAYDLDVQRRDAMTPSAWRLDVIDSFAALLAEYGIEDVLELGCGTGQIAAHLSEEGVRVAAIDLSPGNVAAARRRGIDATIADFADLPYPDASFGAAFAVNSLIHVPQPELADVMTEIRRVLRPEALLLAVVWGGARHDGPLDDDWLDPPRYFSFYPDEELLELEFPGFERFSFSTRDDTEEPGLHAQILTLRAV